MFKSVKAITVTSFLSMFFLGVGMSIIGAAARNIGLSPYEIGLLLAVQNLGFVISVVISGALADTYQKPRILMAGSLILAVSFFTFYLSDIFLINALIMFFIGVGIGSYEGVTDAMLLEVHQERKSLYIGINHFFVTFGSIIITLYLIFIQMDWRQSVVQSGIAVLLLAAAFALLKLENKPKSQENYLARIKILAQDRTLLVLFAAVVLVVGVETGSIGILTTYLMDLRDFSQVTSKIGLLVFLVGMATGRLVIGYFTREDRIPGYVLSLFGVSVLFFAGLYFTSLDGVTYPIIFLAGLAISAILPLIITLAGLLYKDMAGTVLGAIKVAIPVGGMLTPFVMSLMASYGSFQTSLLVFPGSFLIGFLLLLIPFRRLKSFTVWGEQTYEPEAHSHR